MRLITYPIYIHALTELVPHPFVDGQPLCQRFPLVGRNHPGHIFFIAGKDFGMRSKCIRHPDDLDRLKTTAGRNFWQCGQVFPFFVNQRKRRAIERNEQDVKSRVVDASKQEGQHGGSLARLLPLSLAVFGAGYGARAAAGVGIARCARQDRGLHRRKP